MKKIFISLLMVAASLNVMAVTFTSKAKLTLKSSDNKSCTLGIGESEDLSDGLNNGYYAELNEEGKEVQFYVSFGGKKYQSFSSNAATMQDLQLGVKTNASTTYTLTASNVSGSLKIKFAGVEYTIDANGTVFSDVALAASSVLPAAGDEANYVVNPSAPLVQGICFNYNKLQLTKYDGATVEVFADGAATAALTQVVAGDAQFDIDLSTLASGKYKVVVSGIATPEEYIIDVKPAVTVVP
jgi:hypothetical protein